MTKEESQKNNLKNFSRKEDTLSRIAKEQKERFPSRETKYEELMKDSLRESTKE